MYKFSILQRIYKEGIIAIIRADSVEDALKMSDACIDGGVTCLEISFTTPDTPDVIKTLSKRYADKALIGAGTVLDAETARIAILSGSKFVLAPNLNLEVIQTCNRYQVVSMPGVATATEVVHAMEAGADIIKVFPGEAFGAGYLKVLRAPLPQAPLMPSGGVTLENTKDWFENGAVAVGVGSGMTGPAKTGDYAAVTANARNFVELLTKIPRSITV